MVKVLAAFFLMLCVPAYSLEQEPAKQSPTAKALSATPVIDTQTNTPLSFFDRDFLSLPIKPALEANRPLEDFAVVGIISLPFSTLYSFLGAAIIEGARQKKFPPQLEGKTLTTIGAVALSSSLLIATFSVDWGSGKPRSKRSKNTLSPEKP